MRPMSPWVPIMFAVEAAAKKFVVMRGSWRACLSLMLDENHLKDELLRMVREELPPGVEVTTVDIKDTVRAMIASEDI